MNKKGAIELSMTTIIIIVIGVVILSLGLMFVRGIFSKVETLSGGAFEEAENVLNQIATHDQEVTVPSTVIIKQGEQKTFRIWVVNQGNLAKNYNLASITPSPDSPTNPGITFIIPTKRATLDVGNEIGYVVGVSVAKNVPKGIYGFNANIPEAQGASSGFVIKVE